MSLSEFLQVRGEELISFRRDLHAHPELSSQETRTTASIVRRLQVAGLEPKVLNCGTGLVCDVGTGDGPVRSPIVPTCFLGSQCRPKITPTSSR